MDICMFKKISPTHQLICLCVNRVSQKSTNWLSIFKFNFFLCVQLSDGAFPAVTVLGGCV